MTREALPRVQATRYVTPFREGGSVPGLMEADDLGLYVVKFRGAAQGVPVLIAELLCGELGRALSLPVPEIVLIDFEEVLANAEPDPELQPLMKRSAGLNLGMDFLPGSVAFQPAKPRGVTAGLASALVWFDAFIMNVDRTPKNPNLLVWHNQLWMIDHGAALYVHHAWNDPGRVARSRFPLTSQHVLLPFATDIDSCVEPIAAADHPRIDRRSAGAGSRGVAGDGIGSLRRSRRASRGVPHLLPGAHRPRRWLHRAGDRGACRAGGGRHMTERPQPYEYCMLRFVPRVERGEFYNVGVVMICRARRFLSARILFDEEKLASFAPHLSS